MVVTIIASLTLGIVSLSHTGWRSNRAYKIERINRNGVEAAMNAGIQYLVINPKLGTSTSTDRCYVQVPFGTDSRYVTGGTYFTMQCKATATTAGAQADSGAVVNGVQQARDVTITISCGNDSSNPVLFTKASCGTGTLKPVATARVRFERDTSPDVLADESAIVPKVLKWELRD
jgi:hypothetical protein